MKDWMRARKCGEGCANAHTGGLSIAKAPNPCESGGCQPSRIIDFQPRLPAVESINQWVYMYMYR